jgi:hypothetical protein
MTPARGKTDDGGAAAFGDISLSGVRAATIVVGRTKLM